VANRVLDWGGDSISRKRRNKRNCIEGFKIDARSQVTYERYYFSSHEEDSSKNRRLPTQDSDLSEGS
jgi:hypothetical protein